MPRPFPLHEEGQESPRGAEGHGGMTHWTIAPFCARVSLHTLANGLLRVVAT